MGSIPRLHPYHIIIIFYDYQTIVNFYILIYFLLCHIPEMLLNMIVINLTWIVGIIHNVWKTFPAISREVYYFPSPGLTSGASLRTCAPHSPSAQRRAQTVEFGSFMETQQYQGIKVLVVTRDTSAKQVLVVSRNCNQLQSFFEHIQKISKSLD